MPRSRALENLEPDSLDEAGARSRPRSSPAKAGSQLSMQLTFAASYRHGVVSPLRDDCSVHVGSCCTGSPIVLQP